MGVWRQAVRLTGSLIVILAAVEMPAPAAAHGSVDPAASSYLARPSQVPTGLSVRVIDGDQRLWLRADPRHGWFTFFIIAALAIWEGASLIAVLLDGCVLMALPPALARAAVVACLSAGVALLPVVFALAERPRRRLAATVAAAMLAALALGGCGASATAGPRERAMPAALIAQARPIGHGAAFHPPVRGWVGTGSGACRTPLGARDGVHVELFAANRVVLVAAGIGVRGPLARSAGRITGARCYGDLVTLEPTGVVLARPGARLTLADLFRGWGRPLSADRLLSFTGPVSVFVDGRRRAGPPGSVPLTRHAEIVLEVGPRVPPHPAYHFPPGV